MLRDRARDVLERADFLARRHDPLAALATSLEQEKQRLDEPMRVAVAGLIKRGKSTLVNALLGGEISPTGVEETTYNVVEFRHDDTPSFEVRYRDGEKTRVPDLGQLHVYVARLARGQSELNEIERVCVAYPNDLLRRFRLLDVPGLGSTFETDSLHAMARLGITPESVTHASLDSVDEADAVVYMFNRAMGVSDADVVREFGGTALGHLSPVKAVGVLSRVDDYWPGRHGSDSPAAFDPLARATSIADRYLTDTRAADIFYDIKPVIAKLALGAATATAEDLENIRLLGKVDPDVLFRRVRDAQLFTSKTFSDIPLEPAVRRGLVAVLGTYGVHLATEMARESASDDEIRAQLTARSGIEQVRDVITAHFGNRADLIKLAAVLGRLDMERAPLRARLKGPAADALLEIGRMLGELRASEHGFRELDALHRHFALRSERRRGTSDAALDDEDAAELLRVTGEHGLRCSERLGCTSTATADEMLDVAAQRLAYWRRRAVDPMVERATLSLIEFLTIQYELLWHHVHEAQLHLAFEAR